MDIQPETPPTVRGERPTDAPDTAPAPAAAGTPEGAPPGSGERTVSPEHRRRLLATLLALTVVITAVDQVTKYLAESRMTPGTLTPVLGDLLGLQLIYNPGAAFSLATGMTWIFTLISLVVVVVVLRVSRRLGSLGWAAALGMLLGGCLGNLIDRLLREPGFARGHVVDFISYGGYFVGNVADIAIVCAAILIGILAVRGREIDGSRAVERAGAGGATDGAAGRGTAGDGAAAGGATSAAGARAAEANDD
ncbi:signal peptidase II [Georgenia sp. SYP-B2076]|uniref:signal peptidase II n=1 Tax=Georgenia sp. SYP-B2076 TaxID=2495881 RepID=UPI000F8D1210|nr:signal peptidase II [Georgenia sp. SYP-B2076]